MPTTASTIILGAGPAGLQLGHILERAQQDYLILEQGTPGSFFSRHPRHRKLISINKVYTGHSDPELNLRWDWNSLLTDDPRLRFAQYTEEYFPQAEHMLRYLSDFADLSGLRIRCGVRISHVTRDSGQFVLTDSAGRTYHANRLVVATGVPEPYVPDIPGIEHAENYVDMPVDPREFTNQRVLILGKGNSGFETADNLIATASVIHLASKNPMTMAWKSKYVGHVRAVNNNLVDTYQLKSQNVIIDAECTRIERANGQYRAHFRYSHAHDEEEEISYDRVLCCTGFRFDDSIFAGDTRPALAISARFPDMTSAFESTNIPNMYFAGTITQRLDHKKKQSGFIHGFRYNVRCLANIMALRTGEKQWPQQTLDPTPSQLAKTVLARVNQDSALWHQTGFIADILVVQQGGASARYYEEVPTDFAATEEFQRHIGGGNDYFTITLEFGNEIIDRSPDPLAITRIHKNDVANADQSTGIHPIVRHYVDGEPQSVHHVIEDVESEWVEDVHIRPLVDYFANELRVPQSSQAN
ncbi:pyridine nucleotide-disulfide oxidoreductase [Tamaricihabitans halophyticus]|uniref:Pyridine nucleotide-disulfide oxidoreductase n=1 Tax=Tamaricihabitans halophyticus TaxID=1262583 RepID=A0A4R2R2E0_9PSEU|nr:NAD(P)-binding domain-containing protein [Tamaricihabitans halophyticus]TCP56892.1 pyridine nucleotide-disulfide oxidoreductase [Tamaricihabitans halophyticus]